MYDPQHLVTAGVRARRATNNALLGFASQVPTVVEVRQMRGPPGRGCEREHARRDVPTRGALIWSSVRFSAIQKTL